MKQPEPNQPKMRNEREAGMMICTGSQGVGKTYLNMHVIKDYVKDKLYNKVRGRKCLIIDTNGEYTDEQFAANDIPNFTVKRLAVRDVHAFGMSDVIECRRIDAKNLSLDEKLEIVKYCVRFFRNGMLVLEDINTYILNVTHMKDIVGGLVNLRHRAVDVLISYQSLRPVEPRMWQNARWIRMHFQADNVNDIKGKVTNPTLFKIAEIIVKTRYFDGDKRFYVYIHNLQSKVEGKFSKLEFLEACKKYLSANKKYLKEYAEMQNCSMDEAVAGMSKQYFDQYYGNQIKK